MSMKRSMAVITVLCNRAGNALVGGQLRHSTASSSAALSKMKISSVSNDFHRATRSFASLQGQCVAQMKVSKMRNSNVRRPLRKQSPTQLPAPLPDARLSNHELKPVRGSVWKAGRPEDSQDKSGPGRHPIVRHPGIPSPPEEHSSHLNKSPGCRSWQQYGGADVGVAAPARTRQGDADTREPKAAPPQTTEANEFENATLSPSPAASGTAVPEERGESLAAAPASAVPGQSGQSSPPSFTPVYLPDSAALKDACLEAGIALPHYTDGQHAGLLCPFCDGGSSRERSFSVKVESVPGAGMFAVYNCFRASKCGAGGRIPSNSKAAVDKATEHTAHSTPPKSGSSGLLTAGAEWKAATKQPVQAPRWDELTVPLTHAGRAFLNSRGIHDAVITANDLRSASRSFRIDSGWQTLECVAFPYKCDGDVVNVKYRSIEGKHFTQEKGCEKILFGHDDIAARGPEHPGELRRKRRHADGTPEEAFRIEHVGTLIVVEGELDKLACNEAGLWNVVSVPDGAPSRVKEDSEPDPQQDRKFSYLQTCQHMLQNLDLSQDVYLAVDADTAGSNLAAELSRRLGRPRCKITAWPSSWQDHTVYMDAEAAAAKLHAYESGEVEDSGKRKDANEVLLRDGPYALRRFIEESRSYPIEGLYAPSVFHDKIWELYDGRNLERPVSTGWPVLDQFYRVVPGELTVVTGVPNTGKSEFIDAIVLSLALNHYWPICFASFEKRPAFHFKDLAEKIWGKPFNRRDGLDGPVMTQKEVYATMQVFETLFSWIRGVENSIMSIEEVLERAQDAVYRYGIRGLVIDPYNEMEHQRHSNQTETEYISRLLSKLKQFAMTNSVHVWLVAHPKQLNAWKGAAPTLYDISGSAHFNNKADVGMVVHRDLLSGGDDKSDSPKIVTGHPLEDDPFACQVIIRKVRNRDAGRIGRVYLKYDRACGRYYDVESFEGRDVCPIKPLFSSKAPKESVKTEDAPTEEADMSVGNPVQHMMDHGGFL